jgi:hypothetical protein
MAEIQIISPADNSIFRIQAGTAATGAQMPLIQAQAQIVGVAPDPTLTTTFTWVVNIRFRCVDCAHGPPREINDEFQLSSLGGTCPIAFPRVRGGDLTVSVSANLSAGRLEQTTRGMRIQGVNPQRTLVNAACGTVALQKIVLHESQRRQFDAVAETGISECPLFSGDGLGGVGLLQITSPPPTDDDHWNWLENIVHGRRIFHDKQALARQYPTTVRISAAFRQLVERFNSSRTPAAVIVLPDFTAAQLNLDTIRGYNGWAGHDLFGNHLHEFRVPVDIKGNLQVSVGAGNRGVIAWQRVPAADRPQDSGDPDYVNHVQSQVP